MRAAVPPRAHISTSAKTSTRDELIFRRMTLLERMSEASLLSGGIPTAARRLARTLARELDVTGVYWGTRACKGRWTGEPCLSVEVHKKHPRRRLPPERVLPTRVEGIRVDVLEVGPAIGASLSHAVPLQADGHTSTITCIAAAPDGRHLALLCGHGTLPLVGGALRQRYDGEGPAQVEAMGATAVLPGRLRIGRLSPRLDFAVAEFDTLTADPQHRVGGYPLRVRSAPLVPDELVYHHSTLHGATRKGRIAVGMSDHTVHFLRGGASVPFKQLFRIHTMAGDDPFGVAGDSGSLVVDAAGRVIGVLIAVATAQPLTYVLPLTGLHGEFFQVYSTFFS